MNPKHFLRSFVWSNKILHNYLKGSQKSLTRIIGSLVSQPFRAPCGAMAEWHRRACFRTRRGGRGEHCEPCAATSGAPTAVNALNTDNRICACTPDPPPRAPRRQRVRSGDDAPSSAPTVPFPVEVASTCLMEHLLATPRPSLASAQM